MQDIFYFRANLYGSYVVYSGIRTRAEHDEAEISLKNESESGEDLADESDAEQS